MNEKERCSMRQSQDRLFYPGSEKDFVSPGREGEAKYLSLDAMLDKCHSEDREVAIYDSINGLAQYLDKYQGLVAGNKLLAAYTEPVMKVSLQDIKLQVKDVLSKIDIGK